MEKLINQEDLMKIYCYICGKIVNDKDRAPKSYAHHKCFLERQKQIYHFKDERWKMMMKDPLIRRRIRKIDLKIINQAIQNPTIAENKISKGLVSLKKKVKIK